MPPDAYAYDNTAHRQEWLELTGRAQHVIRLGTTWMRTHRLADFDAYAAAAAQYLAEHEAFEDRWQRRSPGPGLMPVVVERHDLVIPLVQQHEIAADQHAVAGRTADARRLRRAAGELAARHLDDVQRAEHYEGARAGHLFAEGRVGEATALSERTEALLIRHDRFLQAAHVRLDRARFLRELGDRTKALGLLESFEQDLLDGLPDGIPDRAMVEAAQRAAAAHIQGGGAGSEPVRRAERMHRLRELVIQLWDLKSWLLTELERYQEATELAHGKLPYQRDHGMEAAGHLHLASLAWRRGDLAAAGDWLNQGAPAFEQAPDETADFADVGLYSQRPAYCLMRVRVLAQDAPDEALRWSDDGLAACEARPQPESEWRLHAERARLLVRAGRPDQAQVSYGRAVRVIDRRRRVSAGLRWDSLYLMDRLPVLHEALDLAVERRDAPAALHLVDLLKARAFAARLALAPAEGPASAAPSADERRLAEVTADLNALEYGPLTGPETTAAAQRRAKAARELRAKRRRLVEGIRRGDPRWRSITEAEPTEPEDVVGRLIERICRPAADGGVGARGAAGAVEGAAAPLSRAALSLYRRPGRIVSALVSDGGVDVAAQPSSDATERALAAFAANARLGDTAQRRLLDFSTAFTQSLEDLVPRWLAEKALGARTLLVSPHADLHALPWSLLTACGQPLVRHTAVGVLPNLACLATLDRPPADTTRAALVGAPRYPEHLGLEPLPDAERELRDLEALYRPTGLLARTARGPRAEARRLLDLLARQGGSGTVLHFACHGAPAVRDPYEAGLMLADGRLGIAELSTLRVRFDEVVLPVCGSALRPRESARSQDRVPLVGDDALTLVHAFHEAGAAFVLGSPVPVGDTSARAFAVAWHRHRQRGTPLAAARAAACELLDSGRNPPYEWAGMTGYGCR